MRSDIGAIERHLSKIRRAQIILGHKLGSSLRDQFHVSLITYKSFLPGVNESVYIRSPDIDKVGSDTITAIQAGDNPFIAEEESGSTIAKGLLGESGTSPQTAITGDDHDILC